MDHSYVDIEALIQEARRQRSDAMGKFIVAGWKACKQLLAGLLLRRAPRHTAIRNPSAFIALHRLP